MEQQQHIEPDELLSYLDAHRVPLDKYNCFVALSDDREAIFVCQILADGSPEMEDDIPHLNWTQVTAPDSEFLTLVNAHYGTKFRLDKFAGR